MRSIFPLVMSLLVCVCLQAFSYPLSPFALYMLSTIPCGWSIINSLKGPMTETDYIIREIRMIRVDVLVELAIFLMRKYVKFLVSFVIGWIVAPCLLIKAIRDIVYAVRVRKKKIRTERG